MDTSPGLAALPAPQLVRSTVLLHACANRAVVAAGSALLRAAVRRPHDLGMPALWAVRHTFFRQFVGGEQLNEVKSLATQLGSNGVRCIVDHSTEELEHADARRDNTAAKLQLVRRLGEELPETCSFVPVKITALASPRLLERLTDGERAVRAAAGGEQAAAAEAPSLHAAAAAAGLSGEEGRLLEEGLGNLRRLCDGARDARLPLLLDAEQTHRQPAISLLARTLSQEYNNSPAASSTGPPLLYNTHQAYLRGAEGRVREELAHARAHGYTLAIKLVRGAYTDGETRSGNGGALQPNKAATDAAYDECAALLLRGVAHAEREGEGEGGSGGGGGGVAVLLATHNRPSVARATALMADLGLGASHPHVHLAQILGMADDLTLSLGARGFNAHKLVPYGKLEEVLPWLLRRLDENQDALGASAIERPLLRGEVRRRALQAIGASA